MGRVKRFLKRAGAAAATGGLSEVKKYLYDDPATQQKTALDQGQQQVGGLRMENQDRFVGIKRDALGAMDPARGAVDRYQTNAPTNLTDLYNRTPQTRAPGRVAGYTGKGPTTLNDVYNNTDYNAIGRSTTGRLADFSRVGPTAVENRYGASGLREAQSDANLSGFASTLTRPAGAGYDTRMLERRTTPGVLSNYFAKTGNSRMGGLATDALSGDLGFDSKQRADDAIAYADAGPGAARMKAYSDEFNPKSEGYLETFVEGALNGSGDKYYDQGRNDLQKAMQRASAARGGFVAGGSIAREGKALSDFEMKRYMNLADLAERGQGMQLQRLGLGFGMERDIDATEMQKREMGARARQSALEGALATESEKAGLAKASDTTRTARFGQLDTLAGMTSDEAQAKEAALDQLTGGREKAIEGRERLGFDIASERDKTRASERSALDRLAGESSKFSQEREFEKNRMANEEDRFAQGRLETMAAGARGASEEAGANLTRDIGIAKTEDEADASYRDFIARLAKDSSEESRQTLKDIADLQTRIGEIRANLGKDIDIAALDDNTRLALEEINMKLQRAGIDAQTRQAMVNDIMTGAGIYARSRGGGR